MHHINSKTIVFGVAELCKVNFHRYPMLSV